MANPDNDSSLDTARVIVGSITGGLSSAVGASSLVDMATQKMKPGDGLKELGLAVAGEVVAGVLLRREAKELAGKAADAVKGAARGLRNIR